MITAPDKPVSKKTRRQPMWAVIRTAGAGSIVVTASDAPNAKLRAAIVYTRDDRVDYERWWALNQHKHALVLARIMVEVPTYRGTEYPGWNKKDPSDRCEWDMGGLVERQCNNTAKIEMIEGRRLCCVHSDMAKRTGELRLIVKHKSAITKAEGRAE